MRQKIDYSEHILSKSDDTTMIKAKEDAWRVLKRLGINSCM